MKHPQALRGVNLGGWLILEKWMTPTVFAGLDAEDEHTLSQTEAGRTRIRTHRKRFIQESDFEWLAHHNVEVIRIPFGYWLFRETSDYVGGAEQLDWAMEMAEKYDIKVLLDVHALPGSQNGNDHSGRIGDAEWFEDEEHQRESLEVCVEVAERYKNSPILWGIEVINEPNFSWRTMWRLRRYYRESYRRLLEVLPDHVYVIFSDAFRPWLLTGALRANRGQRVAMDIHWYSSGVGWRRFHTVSDYYRMVRRRLRTLRVIRRVHPVIIGEWSAMLDHAAVLKLEGKQLHNAEEDHLRVQLEVYRTTLAQFYWSYKTEHEGSWNYRYLTEKGVIKMSDDATLEV